MKIGPAPRFRNEWFLLLSPAFLLTRGFARFSSSIVWDDALFLFFEYAFWSVMFAIVLAFFITFRKAAIFSFLLVLFNCLYSSFYELTDKLPNRSFFTRFSFVFPFVMVLFLLFFGYLKKTKRDFNQLTKFLNILFLILIATEVFQFGMDLQKRQEALVKTEVTHPVSSPDVHLIITDGYAGKKQLEEQFHFDNTSFEDSLRKMGLYVIDNSISNYSATNVSMASMLKMDYVRIAVDADIHAPFNPTSVTQFFQKQKYDIINNSIFNLEGQFPKQPTQFFKTGTTLLTGHTFIAHLTYVIHNLLSGIGYQGELERLSRIKKENNAADQQRDSVTMQDLIAAVKLPTGRPKFVYTHFLMPHYPYLFNPAGRLLIDTGTHASQYLSYHLYTNRQLLLAVRSVLRWSEKPPVILLLSDHGSRIEDRAVPEQLRFYNLAAVYLPNKAYQPYYKGMSNVNQFRVLLNNHFGQQLPLLHDSCVVDF